MALTSTLFLVKDLVKSHQPTSLKLHYLQKDDQNHNPTGRCVEKNGSQVLNQG